MTKEKKFLKDIKARERYDKFQEALFSYNPSVLEQEPATTGEIYQYYKHIDDMYIWLKNAYNDNLCILCNEMRAILGHLSEYKPNESEKKNLEKAYGHLRRLSIDTLKTLCDAFDKVFDLWIMKHARYDYRNVDKDYIPHYAKLFNTAHKKYLTAQQDENLGSDRNNNIIQKYYEVAQAYYELYTFHMEKRRVRIERIAKRFKINNVAWIFFTCVVSGLSVYGFFL